MSGESDKALRERAVRERARDIWERRGRPAGQDLDIWLRAEAEIQYEFPRSWADVLKDDADSKTPEN